MFLPPGRSFRKKRCRKIRATFPISSRKSSNRRTCRRATIFRSANLFPMRTAPIPWARRSTKNAVLPVSCRGGYGKTAFSATAAPSCARMPLFAPSWRRRKNWQMRRRALKPNRQPARVWKNTASVSRFHRLTATAASAASTPARPKKKPSSWNLSTRSFMNTKIGNLP